MQVAGGSCADKGLEVVDKRYVSKPWRRAVYSYETPRQVVAVRGHSSVYRANHPVFVGYRSKASKGSAWLVRTRGLRRWWRTGLRA
jgi:hypothetical protein